MPQHHQTHSAFTTPRILHDWPLIDSGDPAQFKFTEYAITLARLIADKNTRTPFTLGISGAWGSGKTTLLCRLQAMLDETRALLDATQPASLSFVNPHEKPADYRVCRTVWFNAWKYADEEQLLVALVRRIVQEMFRDDFISKCAATVLEPFTPRRNVIDTVLGWFSIKTPFGDTNLNTGKPVETPFAEKTALLDLFDDAFDRLSAAWVHHKVDRDKIDPAEGVLVVFIDDLDRCLPPKMIQVLEAVKLFMDKRGCIFVLGADKDIIQQAVEKEYENAGVKGQTASDYLEKVIQLRFHLPPISDDEMDGFVKSQVNDAALNTHWRIVALGAESNPRKVKTFLNDLQLQWAIWQNTCQAQGVNFDDFVRWEVLMRAAPAFRKRMYGIYDAETRVRLLASAFEWAGGKDEAAASFRADLNEQMQRVLRDIAPHQAHFTPQAITRLVYLVTTSDIVPAVPELLIRKTTEAGKLTAEDILPEAVSKEARIAAHSRSTPGGQEIFQFAGIEFVKIPAGEFIMGSTRENKLAYDDERPQFKYNIPYHYWIGRFEVTNAQYAHFAGKEFNFPKGREAHPVVSVSWHDVQKYVTWLNEAQGNRLPDGYRFGLPSEPEWEKAARGEFGNEWPWGNEFDADRCNTGESRKGETTPAAQFSPVGASPYGCVDMAGNVWEWTRSAAKEYPYRSDDGREDLVKNALRVRRGGSFISNDRGARCAYRYRSGPDLSNVDIGFRLSVSPFR